MKKQIILLINIYFLLLWSFASMSCYAANPTWSYKYSASYSTTAISLDKVIAVSNGGYLGVGLASDSVPLNPFSGPFICRFDQDGQALWTRHLTSPDSNSMDSQGFDSVVESRDGGFVATSGVRLEWVDGSGQTQIGGATLIVKFDIDGNLLWQKLYNKDLLGYRIWSSRIRTTIDGHYVIVGETTIYHRDEYDSIDWHERAGFIIKIDDNGQELFGHAYCGDRINSDDWLFNDVVQADDGSYFVVGYASGNMLLGKLDSVGELVWVKTFDTAEDGIEILAKERGIGILLVDDTIYVVGNYRRSPSSPLGLLYSGTGIVSSFTLSGVHNWTKTVFDDAYLIGDFINSGDGNFYIAPDSLGSYLVKVSSQGNILWKKISDSMPTSLALDTDNGLLVVENRSRVNEFNLVSKYDSDGNGCQTLINDIFYRSRDIDLVGSSVHYYSTSLTVENDVNSVASGPAITFEKICSMDPQMTVYMPHLTGTNDNLSDWNDYLEVDNCGNEQAIFTIKLYDENGRELYSGVQSVEAKGEAVIDLKALSGNARCGKIYYHDDDLNYRLAYENDLSGGVAEFKLGSESNGTLGFYFSDFTPAIVWKGMALCNWGAETVNVTLKAQGTGLESEGPTLEVAPNNKVVGDFSEWFPELDFSQVKRILVTSDLPTINGITISGDASGQLLILSTATPAQGE